MFNKAQKLLQYSTYKDIDAINEEIATLMGFYAQYELQHTRSEQAFDLYRCNRYLQLKQENMTDKQRETIAKKEAIEKYPFVEDKAIARICYKYIDLLGSAKINLMHQNKSLQNNTK